MKFTINWLEKKSNDWYVASLKNEVGEEIKEVSINRTNKNGQVFPGFDDLMNGGSVEGDPWTNPAGKNYLFAPKPKLDPPSNPIFHKKPNMDRLMDKKSDSIAVAQERKTQDIAKAQDRNAWMWAKTNASDLLVGKLGDHYSNEDITHAVLDLATKIYNGEPTEPFS